MLVAGHSRALTWKRPGSIRFSDAFDIFPWFLGRDFNERIYAFTPAVAALHEVGQLRGQSAPASGPRSLTVGELDGILLRALLTRWERHFVAEADMVDDRRLFRALDMARAASRMPGKSDSTFYDVGRAVALWVSAFEILSHDGRANLSKVLALLSRVEWDRPSLRVLDRSVKYGRRAIATNLAGVVYESLYRVRNAFLHGDPVTPEMLRLACCKTEVQWFAAPLFRLALTSYLGLKFGDGQPIEANPTAYGTYIQNRSTFRRPQRLAEDAILMAEKVGDRT